ncbi:MAG: type II secretion system protein [Alphaproteobacteria bacterium]|nr:type II secretion system protein [Alphaproteobacteria bacterium]
MKKVCELGRSMVEMLGVLAIIGVLSVGGIAGYSKAMEKHKMNKASEQLNHLIAEVLQLKSDKSTITTPMLFKMNVLGDMEPSKCNSWGECGDDYWYAKDAMGFSWQVSGAGYGGNPLLIFTYDMVDRYVFDIIKEWSRDIDYVFLDSAGGENKLLGDSKCNGEDNFKVGESCTFSGKMCLRNLNNSVISDLFTYCGKNSSSFTTYIFIRQPEETID